MLSILGILTGLAGPLRDIVGEVTSLQKAKLKAQSDVERAGITKQIEEAHDRKAVLVAEAWSRVNMFMRAALAFGPMTYVLKIFFFDKVLGSFMGLSKTGSIFATDALTTEQAGVLAAVIAFYFVYDMARKK